MYSVSPSSNGTVKKQDGIFTTFRCTKIFVPCNSEDCMNISEEDDVFNFKGCSFLCNLVNYAPDCTASHTRKSQCYYSAHGDFREERFFICYSLNLIPTVLMMMIMMMMMIIIIIIIIII